MMPPAALPKPPINPAIAPNPKFFYTNELRWSLLWRELLLRDHAPRREPAADEQIRNDFLWKSEYQRSRCRVRARVRVKSLAVLDQRGRHRTELDVHRRLGI